MNNSLNVYVIEHKEVDLSSLKLDTCYKELMVGKSKYSNKNMLYDSTGDNISHKNSNYCELTGLYWIWKNNNSKYVGLCHYRRFFTNNKFSIINGKEINRILRKSDIILPRMAKLGRKWTIYSKYKDGHYIEDVDECRKIINDKCPEYLKSFDKVFNGRKVYFKNMLITRKELFDDYCQWLFEILFELEKRIDISKRDDFQKRVYGFLSERLLTVWVEHKNLKVYDSVILETHDKRSFYLKTILRLFKLY